jgi:MFS transporter, UMF1 family
MLDDKKTIRAWTYYDWANSAYSLIITSAIFPAYYTAVAPGFMNFFGIQISRSSLASYSIAFSFLLIAIFSPLLSSIADYKGNKKAFMKFFCYVGSLSCMAMYFFDKEFLSNYYVWFGIVCSVIASIGYCGSIVFYNAFLPEIASKNEQDNVSAKGFSMGYTGSVVLMIICFAFILLNDNLQWGLGTIPVRFSFVAVGLWWLGFAQITFNGLKESPKEKHDMSSSSILSGYKELQLVLKNLAHTPSLKKFLLSFFFYNMGVQTVMYMATYFASDELKMETTQLLSVVLIIQLIAILGAKLFAYISTKKGNVFALILLIISWIGICFAAYFVKKLMNFMELHLQ